MARRRVPCLDSYLDKARAYGAPRPRLPRCACPLAAPAAAAARARALSQVNMLLWPRFKLVFDAHVASVRSAPERQLFVEGDVHGHYVMRRYAEFAASIYTLASVHGDGQLDNTMDRLRAAVCDLLLRLSKLFPQRKSQVVFLVNNCDLVLSVFAEAAATDSALAGLERSASATFFTEQLQTQVDAFVEEELAGQFKALIEFVKKAEVAYKEVEGMGVVGALPGFGAEEASPLLRDFAARWQAAIEAIHKNVLELFTNGQRAMDILQRTLSQLLIYYMRLAGPEGILQQRCGAAGAALCKEAVSSQNLMLAIKRVARSG